MKRNLRVGILMLALVCLVCLPGCRGRKAKPAATGDDNIGGVVGDQWGDQNLASRPQGGLDIISSVKFDSVLFEYDSAQVQSGERIKLEAVADYLRKNARVGVLIEGHCDERGSAEYNMALGERRALAVRAYLIGLGIDGNIIQTKSYGEERPFMMGRDESAWKANRRAEFVFFKL